MLKFLKLKFKTEAERNAFAFENKDIEFSNALNDESNTGGCYISIAVFIVIVILINNLSWNMFLACLVCLVIIYKIISSKELDVNKLLKYSQEYEEFLNETEKNIRNNILAQFNKRYLTNEQKIDHISDLVNLINHKKNLNLTELAGSYILLQNEKERSIELFNKEISKLENKSTNNIAKTLIKLAPETNFENEDEYQNILLNFYEYLDRNNIKYEIKSLKQELLSEFKSLKALHFEKKLSRNSDKRITVEEIEHLDGFQFEEFYRKAGYKVHITKKSGDQGADLIVEKNGVSTAIQTKKYAGHVGNSAIQEVVAAMKYYDCDKTMVITTGKFTKSAYELAGRNGVQLIDKKGLDELFDTIL